MYQIVCVWGRDSGTSQAEAKTGDINGPSDFVEGGNSLENISRTLAASSEISIHILC